MKSPKWQSGHPIRDDALTQAQWDALVRIQERHKIPEPMTVLPGMGYIGVVTPSGMFIGIEKDGHTHT